jgi:hypothetical protein
VVLSHRVAKCSPIILDLNSLLFSFQGNFTVCYFLLMLSQGIPFISIFRFRMHRVVPLTWASSGLLDIICLLCDGPLNSERVAFKCVNLYKG